MDVFWVCVEFGGCADEVGCFDGVPVAAGEVAEAGDVDGADGAEDVFAELAGLLRSLDAQGAFAETRVGGAEGWVRVQEERWSEFGFAQAVCGFGVADGGEVEK